MGSKLGLVGSAYAGRDGRTEGSPTLGTPTGSDGTPVGNDGTTEGRDTGSDGSTEGSGGNVG
jgi:hypothetical protein